MQASYTWSKSIDDNATPYDIYSPAIVQRALSSFDRRHMFIASYIWEVPFGSKLTGWQKKVVHGWQISGISSFQSGNPLTPGIAGDRAGSGGGGQRPECRRAPDDASGTLAMVQHVVVCGSGTRHVRECRTQHHPGPGINNWDVSFSKRTELREGMTLQFRAEFFNLFNHAQWSAAGTTVGAATFGQVTSARDPRIGQLGLRLVF